MSGIRVDKATPEETAAAEQKFGNRPRGTVDMPADRQEGLRSTIERRTAGKAALMAALQTGELDDSGTQDEPAAAPAPKKPAIAAKPAPAAEPDDVEDDLEVETDIELDAVDDDPDLEVEPDPDTARRVAAVKAQEKRARAGLDRERAEFQRERESFLRDREKIAAELQQFRDLKARAKYAPDEVLAQLDPTLTEDDYDAAARTLYARTKAAAADPKNRDAVERLKRERQGMTRVEKLEQELAEMKKSQATEREQAQAAQAADAYLGRVVKAASEETPLLQIHLKKNPNAAREQIARIAFELAQKLNGTPSAKSVLKVYEKRRRAELADVDVDVDALIARHKAATAADPKKKTAAATAATTKDQPLAAGKDRPAITPSPATSGIRGVMERRATTLRLLDEEDAKSA